MITGKKENTMKELNLKEMEKVCGTGPITGFCNPYGIKPRKNNTDNEQQDQ